MPRLTETEKTGEAPADAAQPQPAVDNEPPAKKPVAKRPAPRRAAPRTAAKAAQPAAPTEKTGEAPTEMPQSRPAVDNEPLPEKPVAKRPAAKRAASRTTAKAAKPSGAKRKASSPRSTAAKPVEPAPSNTVLPTATALADTAPERPGSNGQPAEAGEAQAAARQAIQDTRLEFCQIGWWRGYVMSEFYAEAVSPDGDRYQAGTSPRFRWWRSAPPEPTKAALAAHAALVERLLRADWEREDQGLEWYEARFRRLRPRSLVDRLARAREPLGSPSR